MTNSTIRIFCSYSHRDEQLFNQLETHLAILKRQGIVEDWNDRQIVAGDNWADKIDEELQRANVILFLVSADFLASDYCYEIEMKYALKQHQLGHARVIPIIARSCLWNISPLGKFQALPRDGKPITTWDNLDNAWLDVSVGIQRIIKEIPRPAEEISRPADEIHRPVEEIPRTAEGITKSVKERLIYDVFKISGVPGVTFVEIEEFQKLTLSIAQSGRGIVVEGPSGIGKTSAIRRALDQLPDSIANRSGSPPQFLSARVPDNAAMIRNLPSWHRGTVVIDDAHRLDDSSFETAVDHLKHLADIDDTSRKLILIGIPQTGQNLVNLSHDLATRIDIYRLGRVSDDLVIEMVELGEQALNIRFDRKSEIAQAAGGSLNIAQALCYDICVQNQILHTKEKTADVACSVSQAISEVMEKLALKFHNTIKVFAAQGEIDDKTCIDMLEHIAQSKDGYLNMQNMLALPDAEREKAQSILTEEKINIIQGQCSEWENHFFFDARTHSLVIDDPQLGFYLRQVSIPLLIREVGKIELVPQEGDNFPPQEIIKRENTSPQSGILRTIKIFLASSSELREDRTEFEVFINRKNKEYVKEGIFFELVIWEDFLDAMSQTRLQDEYNKVISDCDVFVSLFHSKVGKYTKEEFFKAFGTFKANGKPLVYTYFKTLLTEVNRANRKNFETLWDFQEELSVKGHFYTTYATIADLKYKFGEQIPKFLPIVDSKS